MNKACIGQLLVSAFTERCVFDRTSGSPLYATISGSVPPPPLSIMQMGGESTGYANV